MDGRGGGEALEGHHRHLAASPSDPGQPGGPGACGERGSAAIPGLQALPEPAQLLPADAVAGPAPEVDALEAPLPQPAPDGVPVHAEHLRDPRDGQVLHQIRILLFHADGL